MVGAFDRQLKDWGMMDRATCIEREKEIENVLNDFKVRSINTGGFYASCLRLIFFLWQPPSESVEEFKRTMRWISLLDSEALDMQKKLAEGEGASHEQHANIIESHMDLSA